MGHLQKLFYTSSTTLVLVAKIVAEKVLYMTDAELKGDSGKDRSNRSPKAQIPIHYKALQGTMDSVSKRNKDRLPGLSVLTSPELGHRNILSMNIRSEKKGMFLSLDENSLSIRQKVASPRGCQFLSHLCKVFAVFPQLINPAKGCQRGDPQLPPHSSIGGFFSKIKPCCLIMHGLSKFKAFVKSFSTSQALVSLNPLKLAGFRVPLNHSIFSGSIPITMRASFFSTINLILFTHVYHSLTPSEDFLQIEFIAVTRISL
jgi:hypothetical protein